MCKVRRLIVGGIGRASSRGVVRCGPLRFACALGRSGRRVAKREGDGATPVGGLSVVRVLYRHGSVARPRTGLPVARLRVDDGWCDGVGDRNYNRPVRLPYGASAEPMWRADRLYDLVVVLDHNQRPRVQGRGSAIFMHVAREGYGPTEGCIALDRRHLERVLEMLGRGAKVDVLA